MLNILFVPFSNWFIWHVSGLAGLFLLGAYFFPTLIALIRRKSNAGAIFILNFFLGWTFIGWIVSLVWAVSGNPQPTQVIINNSMTPEKKSTSVTLKPETPPQQTRYGSASDPSVSVQQDKINQLRQLKELLDNGVLTQEEFNQQKAKIL
jgi:Superinfection immunity protein/Short C-terminal domain